MFKIRKIQLSFFVILLFTSLLNNSSSKYAFAVERVRKPAVAGMFYTNNPQTLTTTIEAFLKKTPEEELLGLTAILVPHAGYEFSGQIAALAYKLIEPQDYETIVLVGPSHRVAFSGISVYNQGYFQTPLGLIEVNSELADDIIKEDERIKFYPQAHVSEHSIEVQLPFLQRIFKKFTIVPIIMGSQSKEDAEVLSQALIKHIKGKRVLLLGTCDYSHGYPYDVAVRLDKTALSLIEEFDIDGLFQSVKGGSSSMDAVGPVSVVMMTSRELGADKVKVLKYANSGDVTGNKLGRIVGYASVVFYKDRVNCCPSQLPQGKMISNYESE